MIQLIRHLRIDNLVLNMPSFLLLHCNQYKVVVDCHPVEQVEVRYKRVHPNEDNRILVRWQKAEEREKLSNRMKSGRWTLTPVRVSSRSEDVV